MKFLILFLVLIGLESNLPAPPRLCEVNYEAVEKAAYLTNTPPSLIVAMRLHENGRPGLELGNHGNTKFVREHFKADEAQYGEGARSATRFAWEFCMRKHRKEFIQYLAGRYTCRNSRDDWARDVEILERGVRGSAILPKK